MLAQTVSWQYSTVTVFYAAFAAPKNRIVLLWRHMMIMQQWEVKDLVGLEESVFISYVLHVPKTCLRMHEDLYHSQTLLLR